MRFSVRSFGYALFIYRGVFLKVVTFCGHSRLPTNHKAIDIEKHLKTEIENLILQGATEFLLGGYGYFDNLCARVVCALKEKYPYVKSVLVIPYLNRKYDMTYYDYTLYPNLEKIPYRLAIIKRNEYMVQSSDILVAYIEHTWGGAYKTYLYAQKSRKTIINIAKTMNAGR